MKKLYIPTSTLNFNNILSSESISPKAFYDKRVFGYSRWATIPENLFDNAIVLYDSLCYFERPKSDVEDHPLLIEVLLDESQLKRAEGFWYCDHTIYLSPTTTRFLFFSETDKTITLSISESSLETKMLRLYARQIQNIQKPKECYKPIISMEPCGLNECEIEKDVRINKIKGMLYGYYIGSLLSSDLDSIKYLNALKEIHNIFAAILSSFDKRPTEYQNERLDVLFDNINEHNVDFQNLYEIISSPIDNKSKTKKIWSWIFGKRNYLKNEDKSVWLSYLQYATEHDNKENQAITWIKANIAETKRRMYSSRHLLYPYDGEIVVMDNRVSALKNSNIVNEIENRLCVSWLNETLSDKNTNGKISTYKEELAKNLTLKAKDVYQGLWENSHARAYLNDLRRHIAGADFNYKWDNGLLSSIAAVVIAGDDWEKLLAYMQSKEMTDYKLAFAFFGMLNGFANLTRDFTDLLYNQRVEYVRDVYKELYGQLLGEDLPELKSVDIYDVEKSPSSENSKGKSNKDNKSIVNNEATFFIKKITGHPKFNNNKHRYYINQITEQHLLNWDDIRKLSSKSDGWKGIVDDLKKEDKQKVIQPTLGFRREIGQFFYCDDAAWDYIEEIIPNSSKKKIKEDLDWFQCELKKPKEQRKFYKDIEPTNNKTVIEKFCSLKQATSYFSSSLRNRVKDLLLSLYQI